MQRMQATEKAHGPVLQQLSAAVAKCDRPVLCTCLEADIDARPRPVLQCAMAATARMADPLDFIELQGKNTITQAETETEKRQRQQNPQAGDDACRTSGASNDDAADDATGIHGHSASNAVHVPATDYAIPYASIARTNGSATTSTTTEYGKDACAHASPCTDWKWTLHAIDADHASSAYAKNECECGTAKQCSGRRSQRFDDHDARATGRIARRYAAEVPEGAQQIWTADLHGSSCGSDGSGYCEAKLRRCCSCPQSTSCDVEKVPRRCRPTVDNVCCTIHGSRKAIAGAGDHTQGITADCQERIGVLQTSQARCRRCMSHHVRRRDRRSRNHSSNAGFSQDYGDHGRPRQLPAVSTSRSRSHDCGGESRCQAAANRTKRRGPNHGCCQRLFAAAFWQGWLSMTIQYANQKPFMADSTTISGDVAVLKWSHSVVEEANFINEYAAIENARSLALELGSYDGILCGTRSCTTTSRSSSSRRSLGFASDVEVLMGLAEEITMYKITIPEQCLGNGLMPWRAGLLRGGEFAVMTTDCTEEYRQEFSDTTSRTHASGDNPANPIEAATLFPTVGATSNFAGDHQDAHSDRTSLPTWGRSILQLLEEEVDDGEDGPVIMVSSFFIDHETHQFHDEPRILRFDQEYQEWEADARFIWEDLVDNQASLDIVLVRPEPPHIPFRGTVATAIVHQHWRPDRAACLITAVHLTDPTTTFHHSAHSTELFLSHDRVRQLAGVEQICQQREQQGAGPCTIHVGHQLQPDNADIAVLHGLGLHIRIPSTLTLTEAEQNLCRRIRLQRQQRSGHSWDPPEERDDPPEEGHPPLIDDGSQEPEDAISLMTRRPARHARRGPIEISTSSTSPETISSEDNGLDWRQTVIFTMDGLSTSAQLPWGDSEALFAQLAVSLSIRRRDILRVVAVPRKPLDYVQVNLHCMILQKSTEFRPTPYVRLILVDRELHVEQEVQPSPFRRFPTWVPYVLTRTGILTELGLRSLCDSGEHPCHVWKNNILIEEHSTARWEIADGDYIRIHVGELESSPNCLSDTEIEHNEDAEEAFLTNDLEDAFLFQKSMNQLKQTCSKLMQELEPLSCRIAPGHVTTGRPLDRSETAAHQNDRPARPAQDFHQGDFQRLRSWFDRDSLVECSDEGAIAYIDTWYIHHQWQTICRESRPFRLHDNPTTWRADILDLWSDVIDPSLSTTIHLVQPAPPCAMTECVLAHLILEQSSRPEYGVGLITIHKRDQHGDSTSHGAHSIPNIMTERNVLQIAEMFIYCRVRLCIVRLGAIPFGLADWVEIPRAASLVIYIRPLILHEDEADSMELMQRSRTRWRRNTDPEEGLATSSTAQRCARFTFNPGAPVFNPLTPSLNTMSEEIQELHQHWVRTAFSWEGETASTRVQTWFVDQHDQNFWTCTSPRTVRLYEDFTQWEMQIRQTWQDLLDPNAPQTIQVVTPRPVNTNRETAAHVLLIQRPHAELATILTTVVDLSHARRTTTMQVAITTHEHMYVQNLIMALGLAGRCLVTGAPMTCQVWYDRYSLQFGTVFPARDGQGILIQMYPRPTFQDIRDGTSLLQTGTRVIRRERQTHGQVAQTHGPRHDRMDAPTTPTFQSLEATEIHGTETEIVYIHWPPTYSSSAHIPTFVEVATPGTPDKVRQELRCMGYEGDVFPCGDHDAVYFQPCIFRKEVMHIYCNEDTSSSNGIHVQRGPPAEDDIIHMKKLYQKGFHKAVIIRREQISDLITLLHFRNVEPQHEDATRAPRIPTAWPSPQPLQINMTKPYTEQGLTGPKLDHIIEFDGRELHQFFNAPFPSLITDITSYDVPEFIQEAIRQCRPLPRHDRLLIYADGSSQSKKRHCSPLWTDLHEVSDSWCFAVFAEQYSDDDDCSGRHLEFIGLTCQQVLYEPDRPHHIGTDHIGSDAAETEALFWSALWRLAQNHRLPTTFVTDSLLVGGQASGTIGTSSPSLPYCHLRAVFQALEAILPEDHLRVMHTRSHAGEPHNELVDHFAKLEAKSSQYLPRQQVNMSKFGNILRILWMILSQDGDLPRSCEGGLAISPPQLPAVNGQDTAAGGATSMALNPQSQTFRVDLALSFATANVRTFYKGTDGTPGKLHYVREQFKQLHLHFLGLQETRTASCSTTTESVFRLASGDHQGQQGVELWVNLTQPFGWQNGRPLYFVKKDIVVISANPRLLIARVCNLHMDFMIAVVYAPQSGIAHSERASWWHDTMTTMQETVQNKELVILIDANAASGACDDHHVFQQDDKDTSGTTFLRELLETQRLCLPATTDRHHGEQHTWICPATQQGHRIDYVAIPITWLTSCTISRTIPELDLGNIGDHTAVGLEVQWHQFAQATSRTSQSTDKYDRVAVSTCVAEQQLRAYVPPAWDTDIATQVAHCNHHLVQTLKSSCPRRKHGPKKPFITETMWHLRGQKLQAGRRLRQIRKMQIRELLSCVLALWKKPDADIPGETFASSLMCARLRHGVQYQRANAVLRRELRMARNQALQDAISTLPAECHASTILQTLKPLIGPTNLKHRKESPLPMVHDEDGRPCSSPQALIDRWANFFGAMEGGTRMDETCLRQLWQQNLREHIPEELCLQPGDVPTLVDLERAYRRVRPGKAIGADDIPPELCHSHPKTMARLTYTQMLKLLAHGQEALLHKGGLLVSAWKRKGAQHDCSSYRSLLISSHVGKTLHRAIREQQSTLYEQFLQRSQIGGRKKVPVGLGVHHVRATLRKAKQQHDSSGLIFLDLQEAFYRVIRPLAVGGVLSDAVLGQLAARLNLDAQVLHELHEVLESPSATELAGLPRHLQTALRALHTDTHFWVAGQTDYVRTAVGTKPGDPFADIVFGYMFARVLKSVEEQMADANLIECFDDTGTLGLFPSTTMPTRSCSFLGPTWMDDLCITLSSPTAQAIENKTGAACGILLDACQRHGVTPNLQRGKSEILFSFRGKGSRALRNKYFGPTATGKMTIMTEGGCRELVVVGHYQHLGGLIHHSGETRYEMRRKVALGHQTFTQHRKTLFQNGQLPIAKRSELFQTLVASKVTYGTESWTLQDQINKQYFHSAYMRLYRRILKTVPDQPVSDEEVSVKLGLPLPTTVLRVARLRYIALLYKCEHVTPWAVLRADTQWMTLVCDDLQWLWDLVCSTTKLPAPRENFGPWENVLRYHRTYWKRLLQRAVRLEVLHTEDRLLLLRLHRDAFGFLEEKGTLAYRPQLYQRAPEQAHQVFGCMRCQKRFRSHGGEGAHLCRAHGVVAPVRRLYDGTTCPACLREYHTFAKLQQHVRCSSQCRHLLQGQQPHGVPAPGKGSLANEHLHRAHDGLIPTQQAQGPQDDRRRPRADENFCWDLYEDLVSTCFEHQDRGGGDLYQELHARVKTHIVSWTMTKRTLHHIAETLTEEDAELAQLDFQDWKQLMYRLADYRQWSFLTEDECEESTFQDLTLSHFEDWCRALQEHEPSRHPHPAVPRVRFQERVVVHAYSGRRRHGDFQWYLDDIAERQGMGPLFVVSLDLVIDSQWGDIGRPESYQFWTHAIRSGYVLGMLGGPPCCTWSAARGKMDKLMQSQGRSGPRPIRSATELWGFWSLSLREKRQIMDGHKLLAFSIICMVLLEEAEGCGILEHPAEPSDPESPSIWKLPLMELLLTLPGFEKVTFAQGLLGADSAKSTTLLALNMPSLPSHLRAYAISADLPKGRSIGLDQNGHFRTAVLKEYPPALCSAFAASFAESLVLAPEPNTQHHIPADVKTKILAMVCTDFTTSIGPDFAKG